MDKKTEDTMIENLYKNTGKTIEEWVIIINENKSPKHSQSVQFLKEQFGLGTFYADLVVHKANGTDSGSVDSETLIENQYKGKENLKPIYDELLLRIMNFGDDIEIVPKNTYVSLRRKKQFCCLKPATKTRFEIELIIKGQEPHGILELISGAGAMCTHKIKIESLSQITEEVVNWIKVAYSKAA
ncbi:MAG: DUF4287 domain-containing protein [Clostridia bacterium]|nr:DUF4287 domain-containing protein [Clostridia bacterium]